jgi:cyclic pyranopterin phosphate synthase
MTDSLTHLDEDGGVHMVDIAGKSATTRRAVAAATVRVSVELASAIADDTVAKGNVLETARLAGIMAAKRTDELIPLCHNLPLESVQVNATLDGQLVQITAEVTTTWKTGVEMEALTAASIAALTIIDMGKSIDRSIRIEQVHLVSKTGGRRGDYHVDAPESDHA